MFTCLDDRSEVLALVSFFPGACADESSSGEAFLPATLEGVRRCPARAEYMELHFSTDEGPWSWCFPKPARRIKRRPSPVALTLGPYGVLARRVDADGEVGTALDASAALPMILAGADVVVLRRLVTAGR
jgi:hypothetical protein